MQATNLPGVMMGTRCVRSLCALAKVRTCGTLTAVSAQTKGFNKIKGETKHHKIAQKLA